MSSNLSRVLSGMNETVITATNQVITVDPDTRQMNIPGIELIFGVEGDSGSERKYFQFPRYVGDNVDLASSFLRVNYRNANGDKDFYLVNDVTVDGDSVVFSWEIHEKVVAYKGQVRFVVCAVGPDLKVKWNTTLGIGVSSEGLEPDIDVGSVTEDGVAALIAMVEAQSAKVEAEGATQVEVVKAAAKVAQDDAVAQIEAKGASTLATIPGEYTATVNAVQSAANAIRGKVSGEVIRVDDVSPMEHFPTVKVRGKNFWNMTGITSADGKFTNNGDGTITVHGGEYYCRTAQTLARICPQLRVGDVIKFSIDTTGNAQIYLTNAQILVLNGYTLTITKAMLESYVAFYGASNTDDDYNEPHTINRVQIELGTVATAYTPYIDPTTVTVRRCGKNLIDLNNTCNDFFVNNGDGSFTFTMGNQAGERFSKKMALSLPINKRLWVSVDFVASTVDKQTLYMIITHDDGTESYPGVAFSEGGREIMFSKPTRTIQFYLQNSEVAGSYIKLRNFQIEVGDTITDYEPYTGETQIPSSDGMVSGLSAVSPTMTLLTDTAGVNIECEYSRDTNKVIAEILEKITALGG